LALSTNYIKAAHVQKKETSGGKNREGNNGKNRRRGEGGGERAPGWRWLSSLKNQEREKTGNKWRKKTEQPKDEKEDECKADNSQL